MFRFIASFHPARQPWLCRQSYRHELLTSLTMPMALSLVEGNVIGVLAQKAFGAGPIAFATIMGSSMFANLTSFVWARLARGRRKVRFINALQLAVLACIAAIALLPASEAGVWPLVGLIIASRCLIAGIVTIRSTVWRHNYSRTTRASVTGRLANVASLIVAIVPLLGYIMLDRNPEAFRVIYPLSAVLAMIGVWAFSKVRLRGERELLRFETQPTSQPLAKGEAGSIYEFDRDANPTFWQVLRQDRFYRGYMFWQFVAGSANMASETVLVYMLATITAGLTVGGASVEYVVAILLSTAVPMAVATAVMPRWAKLLDHMHIAAFRVRHAWVWVADQSLNWLGAMVWMWTQSPAAALAVLGVARVTQGVARAGGMLAWNLGHNDFADRRLVALYMGIHVTLTGIRGAIVPFVGMALFKGVTVGTDDHAITLIPALGGYIFLITTACALASEFGFRHLNASLVRHGSAAPTD
jgi:hypothetical protein